MITNDEIAEFARVLAEAPPDDKMIVERWTEANRWNIKKPKPLGTYVGAFAETHIDHWIEKIMASSSHLNINNAPVKHGTRTDGYLLSVKRGRVKAMDLNNTEENLEYDHVIKINRVVVAMETKMGGWKGRGRRNSGGGIGIRHHLTKKEYTKKLEPLVQLSGGDVGYIIVIPKDIYDTKSKYSPNAAEFKEAGGNLIPFHAGRVEFRDQVEKLVKRYKLPLFIPGAPETESHSSRTTHPLYTSSEQTDQKHNTKTQSHLLSA